MVAVSSACGTLIGTADEDDVRASQVYAAALLELTGAGPDGDDVPPVFVEPVAETPSADLEVQAELVALLDGTVEVRFLEERAEALVDDDTAVRDDGMLVRLGPVPERGRSVEVTLETWVRGEQFDGVTYTVERRGDDWVVVSTTPDGRS